ncbi:hypothetical protein LTR78_002418 [Recurvomyces mirabilis]|uniref:Uncharacterized protein n=1 Tax=Recurvomyces mirabilis TaxID=574656 RepID=A0AAE0WTL3_9PEZI|nr:hypothetical protein LTR78_002418 [Recurvomyces mirabilis]KAK5157347.1 hypothetical protein LTS14_004112 [Recurvomyces mirabilis]
MYLRAIVPSVSRYCLYLKNFRHHPPLRLPSNYGAGKCTNARPLPPLVTIFMVSKAFFDVAAKAFVTNHDSQVLIGLCLVSSPDSIVSRYTKSLRCRWDLYTIMGSLRNLEVLAIEAEVQLFDDESPKDVLHEETSKPDLQSMLIFRVLSGHPKLQNLVLKPAAPDRNYPTSFFWLRNVKALESVINMALLKNKNPGDYVNQDVGKAHPQIELESIASDADEGDMDGHSPTGSPGPSSNVESIENGRYDPPELNKRAPGYHKDSKVDASVQSAEEETGDRAGVPTRDSSQTVADSKTRREAVPGVAHLPVLYVDPETQTCSDDADQSHMRSATDDGVLAEQQSFIGPKLLLGIVMGEAIEAVIAVAVLLAVWLVVSKEV